MRWYVKKQPKKGDTRTLYKKFLWFPRLIKGQWRWLESATINQEYKEYKMWLVGSKQHVTDYEWRDVSWVD